MVDRIRIAEIETAYISNLRGLEQGAARAVRIAQDSARGINSALGSISSGSGGSGGSSWFDRMLSVAGGNLLSSALSHLAGGFKDAVKAGFEFNDLLERAQIGMETITGSADTAKKHLSDLVTFATVTPFRAENLINYSQRLQAVGFSAKEVIPTLRAVGDAVAGLGGDPEALERAVRSIGDIKTKGKIQAEEIRQLANIGIPAWQWLAKAGGVSTRVVQERAERGEINAEKAIQVLLDNMRTRYGGMMEKLEGTLSAKWSRFEDLLQQRSAQVGYWPFQGSKKALDVVNAGMESGFGIDKLPGILRSMMGGELPSLSDAVGAVVPPNFAHGVRQNTKVVEDAARDMAKAGIDAIKKEVGFDQPEANTIKNLGRFTASSFAHGFQQEETQGSRPTAIHRSYARLKSREPEFEGKLYGIAQELGVDPNWLLNVMGLETAGTFSHTIQNKDTYATGLIQFMPRTAAGLGTSTSALMRMTATQQLDYVRKYFQQMGAAGKMRSQADVYNVVSGGENLKGGFPLDPNSIVYKRGSKAYAANYRLWDVDRNGLIQNWELGDVASRVGFGGQLSGSGNPQAGGTLSGSYPTRQMYGGTLTGSWPTRGDARVYGDPYFPSGIWGVGRPTHPQIAGGELGAGAGLFRGVSRGNPLPVEIVGGDLSGGAGLFAQAEQPASTEAPYRPMSNIADSLWRLPGIDVDRVLPSVPDFTGFQQSIDLWKLADEAPAKFGRFKESVEQVSTAVYDAQGRMVGFWEVSEEASARLKISMSDVASGFENVFISAFDSIVDEGFAGFSRNLLVGFAQLLQDLAAQALAANLSKILFGYTGEKGSAGGGWLGSLIGAVLGAFGGGVASGFGSTASTASGGALAGLFGGSRAMGGPVSPGLIYKTHFSDGEVFVPRMPGQILNKNQQGTVIHQTINVTVPPSRAGFVQRQDRYALAEDIAKLIG